VRLQLLLLSNVIIIKASGGIIDDVLAAWSCLIVYNATDSFSFDASRRE
jgi:hypothetical protein